MVVFDPTINFSLNGSGPTWPGVVFTIAFVAGMLAVFIRAIFIISRQWTPTPPETPHDN